MVSQGTQVKAKLYQIDYYGDGRRGPQKVDNNTQCPFFTVMMAAMMLS